MDDACSWHFEERLGTGDAEHYRALIDKICLMVLPTPSFVLESDDAVATVAATSLRTVFALADQRIARPEEGLIALAYRIDARRDDEHYVARRTSTYRRCGRKDWLAVRHQQTPPLAA